MAEKRILKKHPRGKDLVGLRFGRQVIVALAGTGVRGRQKIELLCDCGCRRETYANQILRGDILSCGCLNREITAARNRANSKHGHSRSNSRTNIYRRWSSIVKRTTNKNHHNWHRYGGRGIKMCDRWRHSFEAFLADVGIPPSPKHTLDRIDNDGNYEPGNVRWATAIEQSNNCSTNHRLVHEGRSLTLSEWARETGLPRNTIKHRVKNGWSPLRTLTEPYKKRRASDRWPIAGSGVRQGTD